ncbi:MAG: UDP-3-O-(3-hydroxymyristoyl)glucosamine N-acyltransferase [Alphaproteobacteria bacterium]|jgi:UDP-3-O-[3-hydroxymyristoyl] glucosamine N-acyltransferase|nr:UDP-3-O-(3-hydroxymyristoyl)glucosamine N-acyltransferase [Alphaproteobacteria bacterium]
MADPRFFSVAGPFTLAELADRVSARLADPTTAEQSVEDVAPLHEAGPSSISFLDNRKYISAFRETHAGACIVHPSLADRAPTGTSLLLSDNPYKSYALTAQAFYPVDVPEPAIAPSAIVDETAELGSGCRIEAGAVVGAHVKLGKRCLIEPNVVIGRAVELGDDCTIGSCATLSHCLIGDRVRIYPGARIGQDGFGFAPAATGHTKVPQLGRVIIRDDCEIGANTCIDRGSGPDTVIGKGTWLDNLVQIGHNAKTGAGCVMAGQSGISGSTEIGDFVQLGGQSGLAGHLHIGDGVRIAAQSGVIKDVSSGTSYGGTPAVPIRDWHRQSTILAHLAKSGKQQK